MEMFKNKFFQFLALVLMIVVIVFLIASISEKTQFKEDNLISVSGTGEVYVTPDIGSVSFSVVTENRDVSVASDENATKMNDVIEYIKSESVESKDIKTSGYNISPRYEWNNDTGKRSLVGYEVTQTISVKIRDLSKVGTIISNATSKGANDVSSLSFVIDDDEEAKAQAKELAIENAKKKAEDLEKMLGIKMVRIVSYSEYSSDMLRATSYDYAVNESMKVASSIAPTIEVGENKVTSTVTITYSIK
jgi:hypothetical protein